MQLHKLNVSDIIYDAFSRHMLLEILTEALAQEVEKRLPKDKTFIGQFVNSKVRADFTPQEKIARAIVGVILMHIGDMNDWHVLDEWTTYITLDADEQE